MSVVDRFRQSTTSAFRDPFQWRPFQSGRASRSSHHRTSGSASGRLIVGENLQLYGLPPALPRLSLGPPIALEFLEYSHPESISSPTSISGHRERIISTILPAYVPLDIGVVDRDTDSDKHPIGSKYKPVEVRAAHLQTSTSCRSVRSSSKRIILRQKVPIIKGYRKARHVAIVTSTCAAHTRKRQSNLSKASPFRRQAVPEAQPLQDWSKHCCNMASSTAAANHADAAESGEIGAHTTNGSQDLLSTSGTHPSGDGTMQEPSSAVSRGSAAGQLHSLGPQTAGLNSSSPSNSNRSGLVCNVFRTTGREPRPLVGATTTIVGDKLYVFGGRKLSRTRPLLTSTLYELDLMRRHWTRLEAKGDVPPPRYFHSVCSLGNTKLVCYGGMSPAALVSGKAAVPEQPDGSDEPQPDVVVMSDIHIYDIPTNTWMKIPATNPPQGRYAHCAAILPSSAVFASATAPHSAMHHNLSSANPTQGTIGVSLDGGGGAEMIVVGGQDSGNHYIEQISIFNLRSLKWTSTDPFGRSCGAYRSIVAPLSPTDAKSIGTKSQNSPKSADETSTSSLSDQSSGWSMLVYSNYNFLDVKLELQVRGPDGVLAETPMQSQFTPPGLRFPNGGIINGHFVVCGTFLTSSKQEYALWALDLASLSWSRIDTGPSNFSQGSWNRGVLWQRRNNFVVLGNKRRSLVEDYNHRRINFANIAIIELESFGLYDNPRRMAPASSFQSASSPLRNLPIPISLNTKHPSTAPAGRQMCSAAEELGAAAMAMDGLADMEFVAIGGERIPVNSRTVARRWGPYFNQVFREGIASATGTESETATLRPNVTAYPSRNSSITITPSIRTVNSGQSTLADRNASLRFGASTMSIASGATATTAIDTSPLEPPDARTPINPSNRPRALFLPHTYLTIQALIHFLYMSSLPPVGSQLCTPQILCSLIQLARPYRVDGLLEAIVERLHSVLDGRNTAAIFNATAMAAGSGDGVTFYSAGLKISSALGIGLDADMFRSRQSSVGTAALAGLSEGLTLSSPPNHTADGSHIPPRPLTADIDVRPNLNRRSSTASSVSDNDVSSTTSAELSDASDASGTSAFERPGQVVWNGELSAIIGLQKRALRGLIEGRRLREMGGRDLSGKEAGAANASSAL